MNVSKYLKSGYACLFVETTEIKRCSNSIRVDEPFTKEVWNFIEGIDNNGQKEMVDQLGVLTNIAGKETKAIVLENYDIFIDNPQIMQAILNNYTTYKNNQTCIIIVGTNSKKIPAALKELIPVIQFDMPSKDEIYKIMEALVEEASTALTEERKQEFDFTITDDVVTSCSGLSWEEIENILALSLVEHKSFSIKTILEKKREIIRATGFMDFMAPEPVENLGGLENLKQYIYKRKEAFKPNSKKPKLKSMLLVGVSGTGKSQSVKCIASIFDFPLIILDVGALKGGIVGETEKNVRLACKTIDSISNCIILVDEIEKSLGGAKSNMDSGVSQGMLGYLLTWMQERKSDGVVIATANDISALPVEMLRAGRWGSIFYTDLPNAAEVKEIVKIMNRKYASELPETEEFYNELAEEGWIGAEIEQLAKDIHFDDIETAKSNIPLLSDYRKDEIEEVRAKASQFRSASAKVNKIVRKKKVTLRNKGSRLSNLH